MKQDKRLVSSRIKNACSGLFAVLLVAVSLTCEEALPPFEDPSNPIRAGVLRTRYVLVVDDNSMEIMLTIRHQYDETLEGVTNLDGSVTITSARLPSIHKTINFNYTSLTAAQRYDSSTKTLRFDPGDTLIFRMRWDFVDDAGDSLRNTFFRYNADPNCKYRCIAEEEILLLTANLRLFDNVPSAAYGPEQVSFCYVTDWVDGRVCTPINTAFPCSYSPAVKIPCDSLSE